MSIDQTRSVDQMELPWAVNDGTDRNARNFIQRWGKAVRLNDLTDEWDVVCVRAPLVLNRMPWIIRCRRLRGKVFTRHPADARSYRWETDNLRPQVRTLMEQRSDQIKFKSFQTNESAPESQVPPGGLELNLT